MAADDPYALPPDLPAPVDDGAADHLEVTLVPALDLPATEGGMANLAQAARQLLVLYIYPRTGRPGEPSPPGWDDIPGARGCTPQACTFRNEHGELRALGARVHGLSAQPLADQQEFAARVGLPYTLLSDPQLTLADVLHLPTFTGEGRRFYKRLTVIARTGSIVKVFYPVFPPDRNAAEGAAWLSSG